MKCSSWKSSSVIWTGVQSLETQIINPQRPGFRIKLQIKGEDYRSCGCMFTSRHLQILSHLSGMVSKNVLLSVKTTGCLWQICQFWWSLAQTSGAGLGGCTQSDSGHFPWSPPPLPVYWPVSCYPFTSPDSSELQSTFWLWLTWMCCSSSSTWLE